MARGDTLLADRLARCPGAFPTQAPFQTQSKAWRKIFYAAWRKASGGFTLERDGKHRNAKGRMEYDTYLPHPSRRRSLYTLNRKDGEPVALFEAHWADWDQEGRLVATVGGRVLEGKFTSDGKLLWRQLAANA
jgi:hypothetical protein